MVGGIIASKGRAMVLMLTLRLLSHCLSLFLCLLSFECVASIEIVGLGDQAIKVDLVNGDREPGYAARLQTWESHAQQVAVVADLFVDLSLR